MTRTAEPQNSSTWVPCLAAVAPVAPVRMPCQSTNTHTHMAPPAQHALPGRRPAWVLACITASCMQQQQCGGVWQQLEGLERAGGGSWRPLAPIFAAVVWEWWCGSPGCDRVCVQSDTTGWGGGRSGSLWGECSQARVAVTGTVTTPCSCTLCAGCAAGWPHRKTWCRQVPRTGYMYACTRAGQGG